MVEQLWSMDALAGAAVGRVEGEASAFITGFSIDTRALEAGDVFVALKDQRDGHDFLSSAFKAGAAAALVSETYARQDGDGVLIRVDDPLLALERIGRAARQRLQPEARVVAVTGSAGKTGTKEMLRACLARLGPVHASIKSFNNHWGVPLTLARMPAASRFGVFEIGMNHAGEITPLSGMVAPHAAIITTVEAVHLEHFGSVEAIADAKAEIFDGVVDGGSAILKRDNPHFDRLADKARRRGLNVISFGIDARADVHVTSLDLGADASHITCEVLGRRVPFSIAIPGRHIAENALAVVAVLTSLGVDVETAIAALADLAPPDGRGARYVLGLKTGRAMLIDESYNANPASMRAALLTLAAVPRTSYGRRIAVLGDMLELGAQSVDLHRDLAQTLVDAGVNQLFVCGPHMKALYDAAPADMRGAYAATASSLQPALADAIAAGDVVMVKGSNGMRLQPLVAALRALSADVAPALG
ncbi:MAG: UDP-N-acetylmuramoylalanyl-D-glutamyl-2,6-diaminopimelate--D-alanyl-D-alanine ligase [Hyphomicrobium sp.]